MYALSVTAAEIGLCSRRRLARPSVRPTPLAPLTGNRPVGTLSMFVEGMLGPVVYAEFCLEGIVPASFRCFVYREV